MSGLSDCIGQSSPEEIDPLPGQYIIFQIVVVVESVDYVVVFVVVTLMGVIVLSFEQKLIHLPSSPGQRYFEMAATWIMSICCFLFCCGCY